MHCLFPAAIFHSFLKGLFFEIVTKCTLMYHMFASFKIKLCTSFSLGNTLLKQQNNNGSDENT